MGAVWTAVYLAAVVGLAGRATGALWTVRARPTPQPARRAPSWAATAADRGWFPGGDEDEPAPAPEEPK